MADSHSKAPPTQQLPGFEFLQDMFKTAGAALPPVGAWAAPTLDPQELDKRIEELRTVQFWLEQNTRMIGATIQALEVQRMTLSTLQTMNLNLGDLRASMKLRDPVAAPPAAAGKGRAPPAGVVDPRQWWDALTQQFVQLAAGAMKSSPDAKAASSKPRAAATAKPAAAGSPRRKPRG
jgi:hypothetical protein